MRVMPEPGAQRWPRMVRGSVVTHRRRCGKPNCRCATGEELHESTVLSYSEAGRTRFVMLPAGEVAAVRAAVERYRAAQAKLAAVSAACCGAEASGFDTSRALFETVVSFLDGAEAAALSHAELEERLDTGGRALLRRLLAD